MPIGVGISSPRNRGLESRVRGIVKVFGLLANSILACLREPALDTAITRPFVAYNVRYERKRKPDHLPQVRWARWQAMHARRAFFRRGRLGSRALEAALGVARGDSVLSSSFLISTMSLSF